MDPDLIKTGFATLYSNTFLRINLFGIKKKTVQDPLSVRFENLQITASMHIRPQEYNQFEQDIFR